MDQVWLWAVLVVLIVAGLAVALLLRGRERDGRVAPAPEDVASASLAAAAGGVAGAVGAVGLAAAAAGAARAVDEERGAAEPASTVSPGPHAGSALPAADGSAPSPEYRVKVNAGTGRYYPPESPYYVRTRCDLWFRTSTDAEAAGFTAWNAR